MARRPIKLGTDFSGLEAPTQALELLGLPHELHFASESQAHLRTLIENMFFPKVAYADIAGRDVTSMPFVDLYVAGPPCQPWSRIGTREGLKDSRGRGALWFRPLTYIEEHKPTIVILENVIELGRPNSVEGQQMKQRLESSGYRLYISVANTLCHGLPQNRPISYLVAIQSHALLFDFDVPEPVGVKRSCGIC